MPFELNENCVIQIMPDGSKKEIKCHDTHEQAQAHLTALNANVREDEHAGKLGDFVRTRREGLGMTVAQLAEKAELAPAIVSNIESGNAPSPPEPVLVALAGGLDVGVDRLRGMLPKAAIAKNESFITEGHLEAKDLTGNTWDVVIIGAQTAADVVAIEGREFIKSKNGRLYSVKALRESLPLWEGIKVFDNHLTQQEFDDKQGMRSPAKEWLGTLSSPVWDEARKQLRATFHVVDEGLAGKLKRAFEAKVLNSIGLSIVAFPILGQEANINGERMPTVEGFEKIVSVDLVGEPAAGGSIGMILAGVNSGNDRRIDMTPEEVKEMIEKALAAALAAQAQQMTVNNIPPEPTPSAPVDPEPAPVGGDDPAIEPEPAPTPVDSDDRIAALESRLALSEKLRTANLPPAFEQATRTAFSGRVFEVSELDAFILNLKDAQAATDPTGRVTEVGGQQGAVKVGLSGDEKFQLEFMRLAAGNNPFAELEHNKDSGVKNLIQETKIYKSWLNEGKPNTGQYIRISDLIRDMNMTAGGSFSTAGFVMEANTLATLASITKNTVNLFAAADYSVRPRWWESLVTTEQVTTIDESTLVRTFAVQNLPVVNEGAAYLPVDWVDEEETASFIKRGEVVVIPIEVLMRDKLNKIRSLPQILANAWWNTQSAQVAGVFTTNSDAGPVLSDTGALFNATAATSAGGHANLLTTALSFASFSAARTAMRKQTDQTLGAGNKLQINPRFLLVSEDLETTALQIKNSELEPGTADNDINPFFQRIEVVVVPEWTDVNNWALVADPAVWKAIYQIVPTGMTTPRIFTADDPTQGSLFTNDTLRFKVQMMIYEFSSTYRVAPVADFRPLHKSNVA